MNVFNRIAKKGKLTLGVVFPIESYQGAVPQMKDQEKLAKQVEDLGFSALWFRDVPFNDPSFGDAGQMYDPWIYMTHIMNHTSDIALCTGSVILPLRHPVHTAKSIQSLQSLSNGRLILGVASGDRPIEYPAFNQDLEQKAALFRDSFLYTKSLLKDFPSYQSKFYGTVDGNIDILPKSNEQTPFLVTGHSGQSLDWIAEHADGWLYYPRNLYFLSVIMEDWHKALNGQGYEWKPFMQSLYIDLVKEKTEKATPIHLGFSSDIHILKDFLEKIEAAGVNHVILNLKFNRMDVLETLQIISDVIINRK